MLPKAHALSPARLSAPVPAMPLVTSRALAIRLQTMTFMFENQSADRISDFELKLMDIDSEHLGIPGSWRNSNPHT